MKEKEMNYLVLENKGMLMKIYQRKVNFLNGIMDKTSTKFNKTKILI